MRRGEAGALSVAAVAGIPGELPAHAVRQFRAAYPEVDLALCEMDAPRQLAELEDGSIDVAMIRHIARFGRASATVLDEAELGGALVRPFGRRRAVLRATVRLVGRDPHEYGVRGLGLFQRGRLVDGGGPVSRSPAVSSSDNGQVTSAASTSSSALVSEGCSARRAAKVRSSRALIGRIGASVRSSAEVRRSPAGCRPLR